MDIAQDLIGVNALTDEYYNTTGRGGARLECLTRDFVLRLKLRKRLLNRLARRLNRISSAMDGQNVNPPALPKYGDDRLMLQKEEMEAFWKECEGMGEVLTRVQKERKEAKEVWWKNMEELKEKEEEIKEKEELGEEDKESENAMEEDKESDNDNSTDAMDTEETETETETKEEDKTATNEEPKEEQPATLPPTPKPTILPNNPTDYPKLTTYDIGYDKLTSPTTTTTTYTLATQPDPILESFQNLTSVITGIGATNRTMNAREKEVEYKRWCTDIIKRMVEQPTFDDLGRGKGFVWDEEGRRKRLREERERLEEEENKKRKLKMEEEEKMKEKMEVEKMESGEDDTGSEADNEEEDSDDEDEEEEDENQDEDSTVQEKKKDAALQGGKEFRKTSNEEDSSPSSSDDDDTEQQSEVESLTDAKHENSSEEEGEVKEDTTTDAEKVKEDDDDDDDSTESDESEEEEGEIKSDEEEGEIKSDEEEGEIKSEEQEGEIKEETEKEDDSSSATTSDEEDEEDETDVNDDPKDTETNVKKKDDTQTTTNDEQQKDDDKASKDDKTNDTPKPPSPPKNVKPFSLAPLPSFHEQDTRRIRLLHADLLTTSMHEHARRKISEATQDYNLAFRKSTELLNTRTKTQNELNKMLYQHRLAVTKQKNDHTLEVAVARAKWSKKKELWEMQRQQRKMAAMAAARYQSVSHNSSAANLRPVVDPRYIVRKSVHELVDRVVTLQAPAQLAIGTPLTAAASNQPHQVISQVAASLGYIIDSVVVRNKIGLFDSPLSEASGGMGGVGAMDNTNWDDGEKFEDFVPPPPPPAAGAAVDATTGETLTAKHERLENDMRKDLTTLVQQLQTSEEERRKAWKKLLKVKGEFGESPAQSGGRSKKNAQLDVASMQHLPVPPLKGAPGAVNYGNVNLSSYSRAAAAAAAAVGRAGVPSSSSSKRRQVTPSAGSSPTKPQGYVSTSKYSAEKVKARIYSDGSVMPVTMPKKNADGTYQRPAGRRRKGMDWDAVRGRWTPSASAGDGGWD
eukprot:5007711-Ditylum_brightwellii.AAC.1